MYEIITGKIQSAQKVVLYGTEGIGKSTFAAQFPNPLFIDTEGSTKLMDVARLPKPSSWTMLMDEVRYVRDNPGICNTLVIDTADWAETLCIEHICSKSKKDGIEEFGYGKGYTYLEEEYGRLLNLLEEVIHRGVNVCMTAHANMRKIEQPDEMGAYDHWEMKMEKKTASLTKEWADMVLFANYRTIVINVDNQGAQKGKNKAQGGERVLYTTHHPAWDAKNRHALLDVLPMKYESITHCIPVMGNPITPQQQLAQQPAAPVIATPTPSIDPPKASAPDPAPAVSTAPVLDSGIPKALADLMSTNQVTEAEVQEAVALRGYYPRKTPISNYDPQFINGVLVGAWPQVFQMILDNRNSEAPL